MQPEGIITHGYLVQESMGEYQNIFDSKRLEPTDTKEDAFAFELFHWVNWIVSH